MAVGTQEDISASALARFTDQQTVPVRPSQSVTVLRFKAVWSCGVVRRVPFDPLNYISLSLCGVQLKGLGHKP